MWRVAVRRTARVSILLASAIAVITMTATATPANVIMCLAVAPAT